LVNIKNLCSSYHRVSSLLKLNKHHLRWQQLAFAHEVWQAAEQRNPTAHLPHPAAPMPTATPSHMLTLRSANNMYKT
jgi:hypothetical protein